ncbi:Uncharacterized membrane protein [Thioclava dalianensis]|nr:DUF2189 domain-containing protein [Thioclava dalianensis]SFN56933.1 Uncharacterized membrane protein [Thioclava dalianensis]
MQSVMTEPSELPEFQDLAVSDIPRILRLGWEDFRRAPAFGLFFSGFYVLGGLVLWLVLSADGQEWWLFPFVLGFPLLAPFAAIGLYEVSRRIEQGTPLLWKPVISCCLSQKDRQIPSMAMLILMMFMFWVFVAHTVFALFMGLSAFTNVSSSPEILFTVNGLMMLAVGGVIGAGFAVVLFSVTVIGLPLLLDREIDIVTAMIASVAAVRRNAMAMALWALTIALGLFAAMVPLFLGLLVVMPVLGHASWHMYRHVTRTA